MPIPLLAQTLDVDQLDEAFQTQGIDAWDWGRAGIIMAAAIAGAISVRWFVSRVVSRHDGAGFAAQLLGRLAAYLVITAGLVYALSALGVRIGPLLGALGIVGIALAFALKDILENFVAGIILQIRRPFRRGDQIVTGDHEGRVIEVNSRSVVIDQPDGTRVVVPSSTLITRPIVNLTSTGARRTTLEVGVAYGSDLDRARSIIQDELERADTVLAEPPPEALVSEFADNAITIAARFWHEPTIHEMWRTRDEAASAIKRALDVAGIEIAFPQRVVWLRHEDGEARGDDSS
jgi:small-conductance mechanosensitive channel